MSSCRLCGGACGGADLDPLLVPSLLWLWEQVAAAGDRRGDATMTLGTVTLRIPVPAQERAVAAGLVPGKPLAAGQTRRLPLEHLTAAVRMRGADLTPGAVAAHAVGRPLAVRAAQQEAHRSERASLEQVFGQLRSQLPATAPDVLTWEAFARSGWLARLQNGPTPEAALRSAFDVLARLPEPGREVDRRTLVPGDPHALDAGSPLAGLVLALAGLAGRRGARTWETLGVFGDDLTGGLVSLGVWPKGWSLPDGAVATLPPRTLRDCVWQRPAVSGSWVFVTENPSVLTAAAASAASPRARVLCTSGTVSALEVEAVARLVSAGWRVAVRADFDGAGLAIAGALLAGVPGAVPWRMDAAHYELGRSRGGAAEVHVALASCWDDELRAAIAAAGVAVFEESLLPELLADVEVGAPRRH